MSMDGASSQAAVGEEKATTPDDAVPVGVNAELRDAAHGCVLKMGFGAPNHSCDVCGVYIDVLETRFTCSACDFDICFACWKKRNPCISIPSTYNRVRSRWHKHRMFQHNLYETCFMCKQHKYTVLTCYECDVNLCAACDERTEQPLAADDADINDATEPGAVQVGRLRTPKRPRTRAPQAQMCVDIGRFHTLQ